MRVRGIHGAERAVQESSLLFPRRESPDNVENRGKK